MTDGIVDLLIGADFFFAGDFGADFEPKPSSDFVALPVPLPLPTPEPPPRSELRPIESSKLLPFIFAVGLPGGVVGVGAGLGVKLESEG